MDSSSEAGSTTGEASGCRKVRSNEDPPIETTAEEMNYRLKLYSDRSKVLKEKIRCTACSVPLLKHVMAGKSLLFHPILQVLVCQDCRCFYGDGYFPLDEDNSDTYCRWCANGGNLYCCSSCNFVFCKPCIRRNFRVSMLEEIEDEDWNCFVCNPDALWKQRAICWAAREFAASRTKTSSNAESSDEYSSKRKVERPGRSNDRRKANKKDRNPSKSKRIGKLVMDESEDSSPERKSGIKRKSRRVRKSREGRKADDDSSDEEHSSLERRVQEKRKVRERKKVYKETTDEDSCSPERPVDEKKNVEKNGKSRREKKREEKKVGEVSQDEDDVSLGRTDEKRKADGEKKARKKEKAKDKKNSEEEKDEDDSSAKPKEITPLKLRKDIDDDFPPIVVQIKQNAIIKKTCYSMEELTKSAKNVTLSGCRKMHELHSWISKKNASPRKQFQLSPSRLKKMMESFSKIVRGLKENAEELEKKVHLLEEEWTRVFEDGSKDVEKLVDCDESVVENVSEGEGEEEVNVPETVSVAVESVNSLDVSSNSLNISMAETIVASEEVSVEEQNLKNAPDTKKNSEEENLRNVSDAETEVMDHDVELSDVRLFSPLKSSTIQLSDEGDKVRGRNNVNCGSINDEAVKNMENIERKEVDEMDVGTSITADGDRKKSSEDSDKNASKKSESSIDTKDNKKMGGRGIEETSKDAVKTKTDGKVDSNGLENDANEEDVNLKDDLENGKEKKDNEQVDGSSGGDVVEASQNPLKEKTDDEVHCNGTKNDANEDDVKPPQEDRDAMLEFLCNSSSSSSEESDKKLVNGARKGKRKADVVDSSDSSDSDSDDASVELRNGWRRKRPKVPSEKPNDLDLVAHFDDEKLKKGCLVVVEKVEVKDVKDGKTKEKSAEKQEEDKMDKAIRRLGNLTSLEKPWKIKESCHSKSDSDNEEKKKARKKPENDRKKTEVENKVDSLEDDQSEDVFPVLTDELEMEIKNLSNNDNSKMDEVAKDILVEDTSDSDSDFLFSDDEKKKLKRKEKKAEKPEKSKTEKKDSDSDFEDKPSRSSWRNDKLLRVKLSETDSSEEEKKSKEKKVLDSSEEERRWKEKKKRLENDSDEEMESIFKSRNRRKRLMSSSSETKIVSGTSSSDSDSDEDDKKKRKRAPKSDSSESTSSKINKKKKHRRIKLVGSDSDSDEKERKDSDIEEIDDKGNKGRKNIRKVMKNSMLGDDARQAAKIESERKKRIAERQKLYNEFFVNKEKEAVIEKLVLDFDPDTKEELVAVHPDIVKKLTPHQGEGIKFMWDACFESLKRLETEKGSGCILAHCMGLGKTLQVVALIHTLLNNEKTGIKKVLVICPLNTVLNWVNEFEIWLKNVDSGNDIEIYELTRFKANVERMYQLKEWHSGGGVMILGYEMYRNLINGRNRRKKEQETFVSTLANPGPDLVICDEGHTLKNLQSGISKAVNSIKTARRIVLTGTPLQNNLKEYHCMIQFVKPNLLGNHKEFLNRFVNPISNGQLADSTPHDVKVMKRRAHVLHKMLDGCVQRRDFEVMVPYLPPKHEYVISICLTELQSKLYAEYIQTFSQKGAGAGTSLFNDFQNLQRIWTHPRALKMSSEKQESRKMLESESEGSLKDFICDDSDESDTTETSTASSYCSNKKKRKKLKRNCKGDASSSSDSDVVCVENEDEEEGKEGDKEKEDLVPLELKTWWKSFIKPEDHDNITHSGKLMLLMTILRKCELIGDKILVFSQSLYSLDLIEYFLEYIDSSTTESQRMEESMEGAEEMLDESQKEVLKFKGTWIKGIDYFRIDGSVSGENRNTWCKSFNREDNTRSRLFLISTRAGGMGINLVGANRVILFDASWNPSNDVQSIHRIYRFGQKKPCYVYRFLAQGTMEEKIYNRQVTKLSLASRVLDEHQIERHYNNCDLQELYAYEPTDMSKRPIPILPKDRMLAELLQSYSNLIYNYHEHDSLLQNIEEEELTEEERKAAWEDFENEKTPKVPDNVTVGYGGGLANKLFDTIPYAASMPALMDALTKKFPSATQEQLANELNRINSQLGHYFPNQGMQMYNQMIPDNNLQYYTMLNQMRESYQQPHTMEQYDYQKYLPNPYAATSSNSGVQPVHLENNSLRFNPLAQNISVVPLPVKTSADNSTPLTNKDTVMETPSVSEATVGKPKIKIRSDLMANDHITIE